MEGAALESKARFSCAQLSEVLSSFGHHIRPQFESDPSELLVTGAQIKEYSGQARQGEE